MTLATSDPARAGDPEYMNLEPKVGLALEIKGYWDTSGVFVAVDVEQLPQPRRPKLRGPIASLDEEKHIIHMFGRDIEVEDKTEYLNDSKEKTSFGDLKVGAHVEISCKVDDEHNWKARKIRTEGVKKGNKIKGTVTDLKVDGTPPDTLYISGLPILLIDETDVNKPSSHIDRMEKELFGDLSRNSTLGLTGGLPVMNRFFVHGEYRQDLVGEREFDLSPNYDSDEYSLQPDVRLGVLGFWSRDIRTETQFRLRRRLVMSSDRVDDSYDYEPQVTRLNLLFMNLLKPGMAVQVGRIDFEEPREWLYDEYLDAIRLYYYGETGWLFEAAAIHSIDPIKDKYETWTDIHAKASWYPDTENMLSAYVLRRLDSDEIRKREPVWWGLRYSGRIKRAVQPWLDMAIMRGEDKHQSLDAWAIDAGTSVIIQRSVLRPSVTLGYAIGSGDDTGADNVDRRFRQTGYQDNSGLFDGVTNFKYYGTLLDPELSNLKILTLGVGVHPIPEASIDLLYHSYKQDHSDDQLKGDDLIDPPARPSGNSTDIGFGLDLVVGSPKFWNRLSLSWVLSLFYPGEAFEPRQENALLSKLNVRVEF